jgi:hypothetical protein
MVRGLLLFANYALMLPLVIAMQHWFAAHRYASLADVRIYGGGADPVTQLGLLPLTTVWAHGSAAIVAWVWSSVVGSLLTDAMGSRVDPSADYLRVIKCFGTVGALAFGNWLAMELLYHGRRPRPRAFLHSYYTAWRALAAWLSYQPPIDHPAAFRFMRPWSGLALRVALVGVCLSFNAAVAITAVARGTGHYLQFSPVAEGKGPAVGDAEEPATTMLDKLLTPRYFVAAVASCVLGPAALLFLGLHASWGPALEAYSEHFERFYDAVTPPLLTFRVRSSADLPQP